MPFLNPITEPLSRYRTSGFISACAGMLVWLGTGLTCAGDEAAKNLAVTRSLPEKRISLPEAPGQRAEPATPRSPRADDLSRSGESEGSGDTEADKSLLSAEFKAVGSKILGKKPANPIELTKNESFEKDKEFAETTAQGTSSAAAKKAAIANLPLDQLAPEKRAQVQEIVQSASFFRRLPTMVFAVDPEVYTYFVQHPDVAVSLWRAMNISKIKMWQTSRHEFEADAGDGSTGCIEVLYQGPDKYLAVCDGTFKSPLVNKTVRARSLFSLQTSFMKEADGTVYATHRADLLVWFPSQTVDTVSKLLSPLTVTLADRTFCEISLFLKMMTLAMAKRPDWVEHMVTKMDTVAEIRQHQVLSLTAQVYTAAQKRAFANRAAVSKSGAKPLAGDPGSAGADADGVRHVPAGRAEPVVSNPGSPSPTKKSPPRVTFVDERGPSR